MKSFLLPSLLCASILLATGCQHAAPPTPAPPAAASVRANTHPTPAAADELSYLFGWGDVPATVANPRGGTSRGAPVTLAPPQTLPHPAIAAATSAFERDRAAILALAGDYRVSFHFMETLGLTTDHAPKSPYHSWATEHVRVVTDTGRFISLQHTLVMFMKKDDGTASDPMVMKHWRQDWTYEDTDLHTYVGDRTWARRRLSPADAAGTWAQAVFQVDDSPRYEAFGRWEHRGNLSLWTGSREFRPLPRREHTVRKDYSIMEGSHRIILSPTGWLHEQHNWKRVANDPASEPRYLAQELGLDRYERISSPSLAAADASFEKTEPYWSIVRRVWSEIFATRDRFTLRTDVHGKRLFEEHFAYAEKLASGEPFDAADAERHARETIASFLVP
ncbi:MAG TPA: DUF6607 family protein [Opitutus sp.]|nr:DUF6607 family protein [Opitutus sp.]